MLKSLRWFAVAVLITALIMGTSVETLVLPREMDLLRSLRVEELVFLTGIIAVLGLRLGYAELYRRRFSVAVRGGTLTISSGIFFRTHSSIPLTKVTNVGLGRDLPHLLTGLFFLTICAPGQEEMNGRHQLRIDGLSKMDALAIRAAILGSESRTSEGNAATHTGAPVQDLA